ncbi:MULTISPECIES: hypothetical protein [unclassified Anabaena]|uniref:hypothetical protein n=1 Tax=unclassified Anabaena TaxID=2619674 RepID=UPI002B1E9938|nr:hypothetical protein [Anabaena sp. UHCC 0399]MEA5565624.1 hypothetical protein [Anabaena sp. UHCC 0399]
MNITPYLFGLMGLALLVYGEYILASVLLIIAVAEITFPNLNTTTGTPATFLRFGLILTIGSLLIYRLFYLRGTT